MAPAVSVSAIHAEVLTHEFIPSVSSLDGARRWLYKAFSAQANLSLYLAAAGRGHMVMYVPPRSVLNRFVAAALLLTLTACSQLCDARKPPPDKGAPRAQLSIGYSLLYQEADGIPKLKWLLMFKDKPEEMGRLTNDLVSYYQQLADTMRRLSKQYPAMRIDVAAMSEIEGDERKAIGEDLAKDLAPIVGKTGVEFEREALLMFYNSLNEQRHLTGVMVGRETDPALKKFLETTKTQLQAHYEKVGALLNRRYFTH
jgi:predicted small lipoprotein YifL